MLFRSLQVIVTMLAAMSAAADTTAVIIECSKKNDFVAVHYVAVESLRDRLLSKIPGTERIDPWTLVTVKDDRIVEQASTTRECVLSDGTYSVQVGPTPGNYNVQGSCGAHMSAWTNLYKDKNIITGTEFEARDCWDTEAAIRTTVLWRVGAKDAAIVEESYEAFIQ